MGYGTLLFGYFLTYAFSLSRVYFFTDIIGALVMLWAFSKLIAYNRYYRGSGSPRCACPDVWRCSHGINRSGSRFF